MQPSETIDDEFDCDYKQTAYVMEYWRTITLIIIIIIAPLTTVSEDQRGDLECMYKACQAAITDGGLFTDTGVEERGENKRQSENDCEMKTVSRVKVPEKRQD